jgi:23S rRNA (uridine2552-2'-O)-methyltransferase
VTYRRKDAYYRRAKAAGYRARSAYKLLELDRRFAIFRRGDVVVDLGAWPGGWLQVARERVGAEGLVIGVDVTPIDPLGTDRVTLLTGDVRDPGTIEAVRGAMGRPADLVLSDLAPNLTGVPATDEARRAELVDAVIASLDTLLRPAGRLLVKLFMDPSYSSQVSRLRQRFSTLKATRPDSTRRGSAEIYAFADGFQPQ